MYQATALPFTLDMHFSAMVDKCSAIFFIKINFKSSIFTWQQLISACLSLSPSWKWSMHGASQLRRCVPLHIWSKWHHWWTMVQKLSTLCSAALPIPLWTYPFDWNVTILRLPRIIITTKIIIIIKTINIGCWNFWNYYLMVSEGWIRCCSTASWCRPIVHSQLVASRLLVSVSVLGGGNPDANQM